MSEERINPFESFSVVYKVLVWTGYYKLLEKPKNKTKWMLHQMYRFMSFIEIILFNIQHLAFIMQRWDNMEVIFDSSIIEIPQLNLVVKFLTVNLQTKRIGIINDLIKDPIFGALSKKDEELLQKNKTSMHRVCRIINTSLSITALVWPASHFARRYQDQNAVVPIYVPFDTDTWPKYTISVLLEVIPIIWIGYGHLALDCVMSTYYAQAEVQLKIIKHNLQHLFDADGLNEGGLRFQYRDDLDEKYRKRFIYYVQRFGKLAWYTQELNEIFGPAIFFQFFTSSLTICMVTYKISSTPVTSVPFFFMFMVMIIVSAQVFLYCYFGNLVHYESQSVVDSVYLSDWLSVSPKFRRMLLIAMLRWSRTLTPTVSGIVPLSLNTFVSILRSAYSMYAVLSTGKS